LRRTRCRWCCSFGSWIGGDRDGNPFVTPEVTRDAIQLARGHLLLYYQRQLDEICDLLTSKRTAELASARHCSSG
jgi:phosphoenolpyruvate carboxylase